MRSLTDKQLYTKIQPASLRNEEAEQACAAKAQELTRAFREAAHYETPIRHAEIRAALAAWADVALPGRRVQIREGVCAIPQFNRPQFAIGRSAENRAEALEKNAVINATRKYLGHLLATAPATICSQAIGNRIKVATSYNRAFIYDVQAIAATAIGAAAVPNLKLFNQNIYMFRAFRAGCMLVWVYQDSHIIYAARPYVWHMDDFSNVHNETGPALVWGQGTSLHYLHGVHVPAYVVMNKPEDFTPDQVDGEFNVEVRRLVLNKMGEDRYIELSGLKPIDHHPKYGTLYYKDFGTGRPICRLRVTNRSPEPDGTYRIYWLPINPNMYAGDAGVSAHAAAASTWRTKPGGSELFFEDWNDYNPIIET